MSIPEKKRFLEGMKESISKLTISLERQILIFVIDTSFYVLYSVALKRNLTKNDRELLSKFRKMTYLFAEVVGLPIDMSFGPEKFDRALELTKLPRTPNRELAKELEEAGLWPKGTAYVENPVKQVNLEPLALGLDSGEFNTEFWENILRLCEPAKLTDSVLASRAKKAGLLPTR